MRKLKKGKGGGVVDRSPETKLYRWGLAFLIALAAAVFFKRIFFPDFSIVDAMPPCIFHTITGYYCPGCGGTRAAAALLTGHFLTAAADYPPLVYCAAVYGWFMISHTVDRLSRHRTAIGMKYRHIWIWGTLIVIAAHLIAKNLIYIKTGTPPFL